MKKLILLLLIFTTGASVNAQSSTPDVVKSMFSDTAVNASVTIEVIDILTREPVPGCTVTFSDTSGKTILVVALDSVLHLRMMLFPIWHYATVTKPGYDTLVADWHAHPLSNEYYIDFYMRKETLTKDEKKEAARKSQKVPSHHPSAVEQGGFQHVGPGKKEILEWKIEEYGEGISGGAYSFLKIKYL